jgi:hypothetical protein
MRTSTLKDLFPRASQRVFPTFLNRGREQSGRIRDLSARNRGEYSRSPLLKLLYGQTLGAFSDLD